MAGKVESKNKEIVYNVDKESFVPAYYQLSKDIEGKILKGELIPGDKIDSESELCEKLDLSKMTIRRAFDILSKKGLISSERGKGTFVKPVNLNDAMFKVSEYLCYMKEQGLEPETRLIETQIIKAPADIAKKLQISNDENVLYLGILRLANSKLMIYEKKYILLTDNNLTKVPTEESLNDLTFAELVKEVTDIFVTKSSLSIEAVVINSEEAMLLDIKEGSAGFRIEQLLVGIEEKPVALGLYIYRGDQYKFNSIYSY